MSLPWDDLRLFLAVARAGSLAGAARALGVNHSTVFRRINAFEDSIGVRVFERLPSGYALTVAGEEMRATAERVEREIDRLIAISLDKICAFRGACCDNNRHRCAMPRRATSGGF